MPGPQLEHGYLRIANELFDALTRFPFSKRQYKVLLYIIRKTYGFKKKVDDMTVTQVANGTGLSRPAASGAIAELAEMGAVSKQYGRHGYLLGINKNYGEWGPYQNDTRIKTERTPYQNDNSDRTKTIHTKDTLTKDNPQKTKGAKKKIDFSCLPIEDPTLIDDYVAHRKRRKAPVTQNVVNRLAKRLERCHAAGYEPDDALGELLDAGWLSVEPEWIAKRRAEQGGSTNQESPIKWANRRAVEMGEKEWPGPAGGETQQQFIDRIKRLDREAA